MFDFSHGPNRQLPIHTERLGLSKFLKATPKKPLIGSLSHVVEHPHYGFRNIAQTRHYRSKVTTARSKVKSRSLYDVLHLHILANVPTQYQFPTPYGLRHIPRTRLYKSRSLRRGQRSNQGHTMTLHTYTPNQCSYQVSTSYIIRFLRYRPDKLFPTA